jgi:hypothetical protein
MDGERQLVEQAQGGDHRAFLELLELLEALMDRETDSRCLRLYGRLHRLAV